MSSVPKPAEPAGIPLSRPSFGAEEERAVAECLRSGWVTSGPRVAEFEKAWARLCGTDDAVAVASGTSALHLALWTLDLQPGDEVITPSLTWVSVPNLVALLGARPVFCEVNPQTLCLDPDDLRRLVSPRTRAIVPVQFAGRGYDVAAVRAIATEHGIPVIEDAAHAIGGLAEGKPVGSHASLVAFSFHPNKNISTGDGGMLTGLDAGRLRRARQFRYHGVDRDTSKRLGGTQLPHYDAASPGVKWTMTDIAAAIGLEQLKKLQAMNESRARLAALYRERLSGLAGLDVPTEESRPGYRHVWHLMTVMLEDLPDRRDRVAQHLLDAGIGVGYHYKPAHQLAWVKERGWSRSMPVTERIGRTILSLPLFPGLDEEAVDRVASALRFALKGL